MIPGLQKLFDILESRCIMCGFSEITVYQYRQIAEHLSSYMEDVSASSYSSKVGQDFLNSLLPEDCRAYAKKTMAEVLIDKLDDTLDKNACWLHSFCFNSYKLHSSSLKQLYDRMCSLMTKYGYGKTHLQYASRCVNCIDVYMLSEQIEQYSPETGQTFLKWMRTGSRLTESNFNRRYVRIVNVLDDLSESRYPWLRVMHYYEPDNTWLAEAAARLKIQYEENDYSKICWERARKILTAMDYYATLHSLEGYSENLCDEFSGWYLASRPGLKSKENIRATISQIEDVLHSGEIMPIHHNPAVEQPVQEGFREVFEHYIEYCRDKGNSEATIFGKKLYIRRFFNYLETQGCTDISGLAHDLVIGFCSLDPGAKSGGVREFLKYSFMEGYLSRDYSLLVRSRKTRYPVPPYYTKEERQLLEAAPDTRTAIGKRDRAIILLVNRLGIRRGDVCRLTVENIDLACRRISFIQYKTGRPVTLPIPDDVLDALHDYIDNGRPESASSILFLENCAPHCALMSKAIYHIYQKYLRETGIETEGRKHGPHAFRASIATSMVNNGLSYEITRQVLGHHDRNVIRHYVSLDIEKLRTCSLEAHPASGLYLEFLKKGDFR